MNDQSPIITGLPDRKSILTTLDACTSENTPHVSFDGVHDCKAYHVVDGDTFRGAMNFNGCISGFTFRLHGINAPELHPRLAVANRGEVMKRANAAKEFLVENLENKLCVVEVHGMDCFGRLLSTVKIDGSDTSLNQQMLKLGLVVLFKSS